MRTIIRAFGVAIAVVALAAGLFVAYVDLTWDRPTDRPMVALNASRDPAHVQRGRFLYEQSLLCWECHGSQDSRTPSEPQAGGREFDMTRIGPGFGYVYATNLTSDENTGIGRWSDGELVRAMREGVNRDGRLIFPVMAYQFYHGLSDEDALAVVAYLRSLPPVSRQVPPRNLSFMARTLIAISFIKPELPIQQPVLAPTPGPTVVHGEYLAWHASGCAECHSPRDPRTATLDTTRLLAGGLFPFPEEGFVATGSNLTPDLTTGIGGWTEEQFVAAVQSGVRPDGRVLLPFMPWPSYAQWSRDDLHAVWLYLRSIPAVSHQIPLSTLSPAAVMGSSVARGKTIYGAYCLVCHGDTGRGGPFTTIALKEAAHEFEDNVLMGLVTEGVGGTAMPPFGKTLTANQIADVIKYVRSW